MEDLFYIAAIADLLWRWIKQIFGHFKKGDP